jgi:hypothetical protein
MDSRFAIIAVIVILIVIFLIMSDNKKSTSTNTPKVDPNTNPNDNDVGNNNGIFIEPPSPLAPNTPNNNNDNPGNQPPIVQPNTPTLPVPSQPSLQPTTPSVLPIPPVLPNPTQQNNNTPNDQSNAVPSVTPGPLTPIPPYIPPQAPPIAPTIPVVQQLKYPVATQPHVDDAISACTTLFNSTTAADISSIFDQCMTSSNASPIPYFTPLFQTFSCNYVQAIKNITKNVYIYTMANYQLHTDFDPSVMPTNATDIASLVTAPAYLDSKNAFINAISGAIKYYSAFPSQSGWALDYHDKSTSIATQFETSVQTVATTLYSLKLALNPASPGNDPSKIIAAAQTTAYTFAKYPDLFKTAQNDAMDLYNIAVYTSGAIHVWFDDCMTNGGSYFSGIFQTYANNYKSSMLNYISGSQYLTYMPTASIDMNPVVLKSINLTIPSDLTTNYNAFYSAACSASNQNSWFIEESVNISSAWNNFVHQVAIASASANALLNTMQPAQPISAAAIQALADAQAAIATLTKTITTLADDVTIWWSDTTTMISAQPHQPFNPSDEGGAFRISANVYKQAYLEYLQIPLLAQITTASATTIKYLSIDSNAIALLPSTYSQYQTFYNFLVYGKSYYLNGVQGYTNINASVWCDSQSKNIANGWTSASNTVALTQLSIDKLKASLSS